MSGEGSIPFPAAIDSGSVRAFAQTLTVIGDLFDSIDDSVDGIAQTAAQTWHGDAAVTFAHHMNNRGGTFELARDRIREAAVVLDRLADLIDQARQMHTRAVDDERGAIEDWYRPEPHRLSAVDAQRRAVVWVVKSTQACEAQLVELAGHIQTYTHRSFIPVGQRLNWSRIDNGLTGQDIVLDSLLATNDEYRIGFDEMLVLKLDDGSVVQVLGGVTDLQSNISSPWNYFQAGPTDTVRQVFNAQDTAVFGGFNPYAQQVKMATLRSGMPSNTRTIALGHSFGSMTAADLAADPAYNSMGGNSVGYNARITDVMGFGADIGWKFKGIPAATNVVSLNNRDDIVYRTETRFHPTVGQTIRRMTMPGIDFVPAPTYRPVTSEPSNRPNQTDTRINAGRMAFDKDDGYYSGHNPIVYGKAMPEAGPGPQQRWGVLDGRRVVESWKLRLPAGPQDTVPSVKP